MGSKIIFFLIYLIHFTSGQDTPLTIGDSLNNFAINLLATTAVEGGQSLNLAISPYTVWTLMATILEGAGGNTAKQLETVLNIPANNKDKFRFDYKNLSTLIAQNDQGVSLQITNAIFTRADQPVKSSYEKTVRQFYGANIQPINFKNTETAVQKINSYIASATNNRIVNFIGPDDLSGAEVFLTSALFFKGQWSIPFNKTATFRDAFYDDQQNKIGEVDLMYQIGFFPYTRIDSLKLHAVELSYGKDDKMSMIVILPFKNEKLENVLTLMKGTSFKIIIEALNQAEQAFAGEDVEIYLPRFSIESDLILNLVLNKMGVKDVFNEEKADLLGMFPHYLYVSRLIQRAEIEVNEEGTIASAASGAAFIYKSPPPRFQANRPFAYFIINKETNSIVFAGKLSDPNTLKKK